MNKETIKVMKFHPFGTREIRYKLFNADTGEIIDDAQGHGYRTIRGAYAAYNWKQNNKA